VAVLLMDTEGSMDIESNKETSIKLSAFSMLLSSYQILNTGCRVKDPDLEYLEPLTQPQPRWVEPLSVAPLATSLPPV
ncbi:unnamed protein product, partial [Lepidochelys kempii]